MITTIFMIIAGMFNAIMDTLSFHYNKSIFLKYPKYEQFLNPQKSWLNKYKNNDPDLGPKFFGSMTFLVWTTDLWHLAKMIMVVSIVIGTVFYTPIIITGYMFWDLLINLGLVYLSFSLSFSLFWDRILKIKK
jgi:hypothetical protein